MAESALYVGRVTHRRVSPRPHELAYRVYWLAMDVDELAATARRLSWLSLDRFNLFSIHARDYGDGSARPLRQQVSETLGRAGLAHAGARIVLFTMPRVLGYAFNPISIYFCHDAEGRLAATLYEVNNTFGERHSYLFKVAENEARPIVQTHAKAFYVSPFLPMDMAYEFRLLPPDEEMGLSIATRDAGGPVLFAAMTGRRRALTGPALLRVFFTHPLLTLKVVAGIHWHALRLWLKRVPLAPRRPPPPPEPVSIAPVRESREVVP